MRSDCWSSNSRFFQLLAYEIVTIIVTNLMRFLCVFQLNIRHILVFSLDQPSSDDNDDIVILSLSLYFTLKTTQQRYVQVRSGARLLRW